MALTETHDEDIRTCTDMLHVDSSGNTTYTDINIPALTWASDASSNNPNGSSGGLSQSDKIAIGVRV